MLSRSKHASFAWCSPMVSTLGARQCLAHFFQPKECKAKKRNRMTPSMMPTDCISHLLDDDPVEPKAIVGQGKAGSKQPLDKGGKH